MGELEAKTYKVRQILMGELYPVGATLSKARSNKIPQLILSEQTSAP